MSVTLTQIEEMALALAVAATARWQVVFHVEARGWSMGDRTWTYVTATIWRHVDEEYQTEERELIGEVVVTAEGPAIQAVDAVTEPTLRWFVQLAKDKVRVLPPAKFVAMEAALRGEKPPSPFRSL